MKGFKGVVSVEEKDEEIEELPPVPTISKKALKTVSGVLSALKNGDGSPMLTKEKVNNLTNLKLEDGEKLLDMSEKWFIYEVVWILSKVGYEKTYNFLSADWEKVLGRHNIRKKMLFENPLMEKTKEKFALDMEIYRTKSDVKVGEKCKKCGSDSTMSVELQVRSSDEAMTIKIICLQCKFRWTAQ